MPITGSVFGLNYIYDKQLENLTNNNFSSWTETGLYGYFCGGNPQPSLGTSYSSTIDRIDFSTENIGVVIQKLLATRSFSASVSTNSYGYFCGGAEGPGVTIKSSVYRLDFSSETVSDPGKYLPTSAYINSGVFTNLYGYVCGGITTPPTGRISTIGRIDFSSETFSSPGKNFSIVKDSMSSLSSTSYGYFFGGYTNPTTNQISTISRLDFSTETVSDPGKNLPESRWHTSSVSTDLYGYICGGNNPSPSSICTISRIDFSTENIINQTNTLTRPKNEFASTKSSFYGYFSGGSPTPTTGIPTDCVTVRLDFSNEIVLNPGINLTGNKRSLFSTSSTSKFLTKKINNYGYYACGYTYLPGFSPQPLTLVSRLDFSTEVISNPGNNMSNRRNQSSYSSSSYGYVFGGPAVPQANSIDKIDFSTEVTFLGNKLMTKNTSSMASVKSNQYGYTSGGLRLPLFYYCVIERLDFSTDTSSSPGKDLPDIRYQHSGTESFLYGYFVAGYKGSPSPNIISSIDRLDLSTEIVTSPNSKLSQSKLDVASISDYTNFYGYFAGGYFTPGATIYSTVDRLDFSTETITNQYTNLSSVKYGLGTIVGKSYGYFGGGSAPTSTALSSIERLDFVTSTVDNPGQNLPSVRVDPSGISN